MTYTACFSGGDVWRMIGSFIIRKIVGMHTNKIGIRIVSESNGLDRKPPQQCCLADPVHAIHDVAIRGKNNGKAQVCGLNQSCVLYYRSACWRVAKTEPKRFVKLSD